MGDESPGRGEVQKVTIQISGPLTSQEFEDFKAAVSECLRKFRVPPHSARVMSIVIEKQ